MRSNAKRIAALTLAVLMSLSALPGLAGEYSSGTLNVKDKVKQPVSAATEEAVETPAPETGKKEEASEPTPAPTEAPTATPYVFSPWSGWIDASEASNYVATVCSSLNGSLVGQIRRGERVNVVEEKNGWLLIEGAVSGWVMDRYVSGSEPEPIRVEKPAATEVPEVTKEPVETEEPEATEEPEVTEEPVETEEPVADETTEPVETEEPVADETEEPVETTEPVETEEPVADETTEPVETEEPVADETAEPVETEEPVADETAEPVADETAEPVETEEPSAEPEATPVPMVKVVPEAEIMFERDAEGNLVLDENGDPIAYVRGSLEAPLNFERDAEGNLVLDENGNPAVYILVQAAEEPAEEPVEETGTETAEVPVEDTAEQESGLRYTFMRDESGELLFDENGLPIAIVPEGMDIPVSYLMDENGNLILDENGDPIVKETLPAGTDKLTSVYDLLDPNRRIDIYVTWNGEKAFGTSITMTAVLFGYDQVAYRLQWQTSPDDATWQDIDMATDKQYSVVMTQDNYLDYWRVIVIMDEEQ